MVELTWVGKYPAMHVVQEVDELQTEQPARQAVQVAKTDVLVVEAVPKNPVAHYVQPREVH